MKKYLLLLFAFVPVLAGYVINWTLMVPVIGSLVFYFLPYLVLAFWFYLGNQCGKSGWGLIPSVLLGNAAGILSLCLYLWQFVIESSETRNSAIAIFSQMHSASTPMYLFAGVARLVERRPNYAGPATMTAMQVMALMLMVFVFAAGYFRGKRKVLRGG